ncbi:hypothetical protein BDV36DRAFT_264913 [Aspergillus pseudocaelatus]|uniref:Uncharacterized protein n=1 Tax=Aspergillus pseudocaelatus TaxID=1825620 RepID=A0ABQ6WBN4_9EURO|nr:hypothetical protein BDV36DRAFT_264913 [Aspergillus pseudocaelatus]
MPLRFLNCILYQFRKSACQPLVFNLVPSRCSFSLSLLLLPLFWLLQSAPLLQRRARVIADMCASLKTINVLVDYI